jgi:DNA helicase-2/ATP-dependent DNA helicase PcrA
MFREMIKNLISKKDGMLISELMKTILKDSGYEAMLNEDQSKENENRFENLMEFIGVAMEFEKENADNSLSEFLESIALISDVDNLDESTEAVTLMTMHSAKGLEFKNVFLVGMEDGLFPSKRSIDEDEFVEEERRLCYVGITRAKEKLYLTGASKRTMYGSTTYTFPSRFIEEIPSELVESNSREDQVQIQKSNINTTSSVSKSNTNNSSNNFFGETKSKFGLSVDSFLNNMKKPNLVNSDDFNTNKDKYNVGVKVKHKKFGVGVIKSVQNEGDDLKLEIMFDNSGFKRLMANFTPLEIIE